MRRITLRVGDNLHAELVAQANAERRSLQMYLLLALEHAAELMRTAQPRSEEGPGVAQRLRRT